MKQTYKRPQSTKKSTFMRVLVLIMAFAMFAGFIILPLVQN
jgi:hypothetical protein